MTGGYPVQVNWWCSLFHRLRYNEQSISNIGIGGIRQSVCRGILGNLGSYRFVGTATVPSVLAAPGISTASTHAAPRAVQSLHTGLTPAPCLRFLAHPGAFWRLAPRPPALSSAPVQTLGLGRDKVDIEMLISGVPTPEAGGVLTCGHYTPRELGCEFGLWGGECEDFQGGV